MADLTANFDRPYKEPAKLRSYPLGAIHVYKGDLLMVLRGTGYAVKAANTALGQIIGVATQEVDNSGGSAGDKNVQVIRGTQLFSKTSAAVTDIGVLATAVDSDTVATGGTKTVYVGRIVGFVGTTKVWVDLEDHGADSAAS